MRIERVELDGFGRFHDERRTFPEGITVVLGENEAGKTTFLNAIRALLFGFEPTRDGRAWYPALAGGRRGGRLSLVTAEGERWVVERHGERGGAGALAVRAPSGNQGGQETLDRLMHGADRDLYNNVFAFGLGELQDLHSLGTTGVRGRIYGAGAGLGGASAVDIERHLRAELRDIFLPSGTKPPLNALLARMEAVCAEIATLATQPVEYESAHREIASLQAMAAELRARAHRCRERASRLAHLQAAAPLLAELAEVDAELAAGDASADQLPPDVVAELDRRLGRVAEAAARLEMLDRQMAEMRAERDAVVVDPAVLDHADELTGLRDEPARRAAARDRRRDLAEARDRAAAIVAEQAARVGGWDEARLQALDDSIPAVEFTRFTEARLARAAEEEAGARTRWLAASESLAGRGPGPPPPTATDAELDDRAEALRELDALRIREAGSRAGVGSRSGLVGVAAASIVAVALGVVVGAAAGQPVAGAVSGALLAVLLVGALLLLGPRRAAAGSAEAARAERAALLARIGRGPNADDAAVAKVAEATATARAMAQLSRTQAAADVVRREDVARLDRAREEARRALETAQDEWHAWLEKRGMPAALAPAAVREILGTAGIARSAAAERDRADEQIAAVDREQAAAAARSDELLARVGYGPAADDDDPYLLLRTVSERLDRARIDDRRAAELDRALSRRQSEWEPANRLTADVRAELEAFLARFGVADADALRALDAAALIRRGLHSRARELRAELAGHAGSPQGVQALAAEATSTDPASMEADLAETRSELERTEGEEVEAQNRIGELAARIRQLESAEDLGARRQELAALDGRAAELARRWTIRALAAKLLEETRTRYERERQPDVIRAAAAHFERITGGRYVSIIAPPGESGVRVATEGSEAHETDELSRGTAEQLYLALRFGLIEEFARHAEALPVVMDDILVNFDADRSARAAAAILDLAARHQVLYFTCHPAAAALLDPGGDRTTTLRPLLASVAADA